MAEQFNLGGRYGSDELIRLAAGAAFEEELGSLVIDDVEAFTYVAARAKEMAKTIRKRGRLDDESNMFHLRKWH